MFRYSVAPAFSNSGQLFTLRSPRDITLSTRESNGQLMPASAVNDIVAVILSHGHNGYGATTDQGTVLANTSVSNPDEQVNINSNGTVYISRPVNDNVAAPGGEFDDLVVWVSPNILYNRMVAAQKLP